ncbi:MAG: energy transducer TonB [Verrucomicrobiota bacterium]
MIRALLATLLALLLIVFLSVLRLVGKDDDHYETIRSMSVLAPLSMPTPPPPPDQPPPPPQEPDLPRLKIELDSVAPPLRATLERKPEMRLTTPDFAPRTDVPRSAMVFSLRELDGHPRLVSQPPLHFPDSLRRRGVTQATVKLEVKISPSGKVSVLRVLESSHPEIVPVARSFVSRCRFTPPTKDGRAVTSKFHWPLTIDQ